VFGRVTGEVEGRGGTREVMLNEVAREEGSEQSISENRPFCGGMGRGFMEG